MVSEARVRRLTIATAFCRAQEAQTRPFREHTPARVAGFTNRPVTSYLSRPWVGAMLWNGQIDVLRGALGVARRDRGGLASPDGRLMTLVGGAHGQRILPALFVLLWSTGFIGARLGMPHAEPMTFLALRFALTAACLAVVAAAWRAPWPPRPRDWGHLALAGLLMHGVYLGGVFVAIRLGLEAGLSALIVSLQPLLVAAAAPFLLAERIGTRRWLGLGLGMLGAGLVLSGKLGHGARASGRSWPAW